MACAAPSRAWPRRRTRGSTTSSASRRAASCCASPATTACARACRSANWAAPIGGPVGARAERLITIGEGEVEVAHEALLREWPRLRDWLEEDAEGRRLHRQLTHAARDWDAAGRDRSELYRGARLAAALDWAATHTAELNATERDFLDASRAASERAQRRLRAVLAGVASLLVLAVIAGLVALNERGNARDEALAAAAQRLGAQALVEDDLDRSLLLARQGMALEDSVQTQSNLLAALLKSPAASASLRGDGDRLISLDLSPDERTLAFLDNDGTLSFVDTRTRRPVGGRSRMPASPA